MAYSYIHGVDQPRRITMSLPVAEEDVIER
jgi:hypothetical protein